MATLQSLLDAAGLARLADGRIVSRDAAPGRTPSYSVQVQQRQAVWMMNMTAADVQRLAGAWPVLAIERETQTQEERCASVLGFYGARR